MITKKRTGWKTDCYVGLSTDEKPSAVNGEQFVELDTGKTYCYDEEGETWSEMPSGGGGGGSVTVDTALSESSTNPVQNKAIAKAVNSVNEVTINTNQWQLNLTTNQYYYTKTISGMTASSFPIAVITYPEDVTKAQKDAIDIAANLLIGMQTDTDSVTFYACELPEANITITLKGI